MPNHLINYNPNYVNKYGSNFEDAEYVNNHLFGNKLTRNLGQVNFNSFLINSNNMRVDRHNFV